MAVDATGNVYLAGVFRNSVVLGGTTLTSSGSNDVFVAKFSPVSNQFVWAQRAGGTSSDNATALVVNGTSVYVAGTFSSSSASFGAAGLSSAGGGDVFVAKLIDAGLSSSFAWAQRAGGTGEDAALALATSGTNIYVAGRFASPTASFGNTTLANTGLDDVFVAKLTDLGSNGDFMWAQRAGGSSSDDATALVVNGTSVYVAGTFNSPTAAFGATIMTSAGVTDVFAAKLIDAGLSSSFAWAQRAGGTGGDYAYSLAVSGTSIYVAGTLGGPTAAFGATILTNAGFSDVFVAKLTDIGGMGNFVWAQRAGGTSVEAATALVVSGTSIYVAGRFTSSTASFGNANLTNTGLSDVFVAKLIDAGGTGSFAWAQQAGGTGSDYAATLAVSGTSVHVAGLFVSPTANFGATALTNPNPNAFLGFLASLTDPTLTATTAAAGPREPTTLFPNPARRTATLRLPAGTASAPLTLTDALGRAVRRYPAPASPETALDLSGLPSGLYLLRGAGPTQRLAVE